MPRQHWLCQFNMGPSQHCPRRDNPNCNGKKRAFRHKKWREKERLECAARMKTWLLHWAESAGVTAFSSPDGKRWVLSLGDVGKCSTARAEWFPGKAHLHIYSPGAARPTTGKAHDAEQVARALLRFWPEISERIAGAPAIDASATERNGDVVMAVNLHEMVPDQLVGQRDRVGASILTGWLAAEAGVCLTGEIGNSVCIQSASYDVHDGLRVVDREGRVYRLRVQATEIV